MTAPGTRGHICDTELGTDKCDNSSVPLQMGYTQGANQGGQVFSLGLQIHDLSAANQLRVRPDQLYCSVSPSPPPATHPVKYCTVTPTMR
ncbi:hypothetical protein P7K49_021158 [Saguinus oedipus]|uniref:Uncharacterized protein n=1 Tax=Saguinus oedipus TaxID=9490 RepID=A0ABQ9USQ7_SAGOE|nr:hypothetical protein P7K49_021158 [Saguinus oedipus]